MTLPPVPSVVKRRMSCWPAVPPAEGVMVQAVFDVQGMSRVLPFAVEMVSAIVAPNVSVEADPIKGVSAAMVRPEMLMFAARFTVPTSAVPTATVGVAARFNFAAVIGSVVPVKE
jgi:hypothetical protein